MKILERLNNTELELSGLNRWLGKRRSGGLRLRVPCRHDPGRHTGYAGTGVHLRCETDFGKKKGQSGLYFLATDCIASIRSSGQLSPALKDWVPKDEIALIRNGEERGDIAEAMFQVVKTAKDDRR